MKKIIVLILSMCFVFSLSGCSQECEKCEGEGKITCTQCQNGKVTCSECNGKKKLKCEKCEGKGYSVTEDKCDKCKDSKKTGYIYNTSKAFQDIYTGNVKGSADGDDYWNMCTDCHGTGYKTIDCSNCDGTGLGSVCTACNGEGNVNCPECEGSTFVTCPVCNGQGKVKK